MTMRAAVFVGSCLIALLQTVDAFAPLTASRHALNRPGTDARRSQSATIIESTAELPAGWVSQVDEQSGQTFYCFEQTGACQWEPPPSTTASAKWSIDCFAGVAGFSGVEGVTIKNKFVKFNGGTNKFAGSLHTEYGDTAHRLEHGREGRPCQLPYQLGPGEEKLLSRYNMVEQKHHVARGQCKVQCTANGAAVLTSMGNSPTLWRTAGGQWNILYKDQEQVLSEGDHVSLDCNDPDGAVFVCHAPSAGGQQQQQSRDLTGGWVAQFDEESGQTYYVNSHTGESQWELPPTDSTGGLPAGWVSHVDEESGQAYYMNTQTGESQWEPPQ